MDIFNSKTSKINITIFSDERKNLGGGWDYMCLLIVPTEKIQGVLDRILEIRQICNYHTELKFSKLKDAKGEKYNLAEKLITEILNDKENRFYFKIFGIDTTTLDSDRFGDGLSRSEKYANIYNRFFRTNILQLKGYFQDKHIHIDNIFHDNEGNLQQHEYFNWHTIFKVDKDPRFFCGCDKITFVNSCHNKEQIHKNVSHFIQSGNGYGEAHCECGCCRRPFVHQCNISPILAGAIIVSAGLWHSSARNPGPAQPPHG